MRPPAIRASFDVLPNELVADLFAGGGGASSGLEAALGRPVDIAINHNPVAIAMHKENHPETKHYISNVWEVDPREACGSRKVGILWASPACTHFSRAKGTANPLSAKIRSLAWVVIRWAKTVQPRVIFMENVEEWEVWGPLGPDGRPDPTKMGRTFRQWLGKLRACGYQVEHRVLVAADYGAPTTRKRLFLVARCDGKPIIWPEATHGAGRPEAWRPAAEVIDWSLPCPSIFERARPLKDATLRRIAAGIQRYVLESAEPFIVPLTHHGADRVHGIREPLRTVTAANRGELALVSPTLIQTGYGEREGQAPRALDLHKPLGTVVAGGAKHALVAALMTKHYGGVVGHGMRNTLGTVTAKDHHSLTVAHLTKFYGTSVGSSARDPMPTVTSGGGHGGGHLAEVRAFLVSYYSQGGRPNSARQLGLPLGTVTTRDRFGLVMVHGEPYQIVDIGLRMLAPHELFAAQGFSPKYRIDECDGRKLTKTEQTALAGNSVCPPVAEAIVAANTRYEARAAA